MSEINKSKVGQQKLVHHSSASSANQQNPNVRISSGSGVSHHHTTFIPPPQTVASGGNTRNQSPSMHQDHDSSISIINYYNSQPQASSRTATPATASLTSQMATQSQHQNPLSKNRKLQVDDALSYLERVRQQFAQTPTRYNEFLEVMKEFKSHTIDTNGVIDRVSKLFRDHPDLIDGFNTFLPPGFEVHVNITATGNYIQINQPNGVCHFIDNSTSRQLGLEDDPTCNQYAFIDASSELNNSSNIHQVNQNVAVLSPKQTTTELDASMQTSSNVMLSKQKTFIVSQQKQMALSSVAQQQMQIIDSGQQQNRTNSNISHSQKHQMPIVIQTQQQPIHFDQALGYLNKIKERFSNKPDIYHQFLAILSNYQRTDGNQKLTESGVYQEVAKLFQDEADLMSDFKSFLPDASLEFAGFQLEEPISQFNLADIGKSDNTDQFRNKISEGESVKYSIDYPAHLISGKKRTIEAVNNEKFAHKKMKGQNKITYNVSAEEILEELPLKDFIFFEKVHNALQNETIFQNFIRSLALYTKSIMSKNELFEFVAPFFASYPELMKEFKDILGDKTEIIRHPNKQIPLEHRLSPEKAYQIDFTHSKQLGVSYRSLPYDYVHQTSSGRTSLCKKVLNDKWVCYPTWSSEDTSVTSKKSCFEEVMCRTEDERFEVDILIETNSTAISALEYAKNKIEKLNNEEAKKWMAEKDNNLGCSFSVISRAIRKIYGEHANKILSSLHENPFATIPQLLIRMSGKDAEWKNIRDEYNAIWRDQVEKNYLKSLDHQALTFKANDVKNIRSRGILSQLETIYEEKREKAEEGEPVECANQSEWGPHLCIEYPEDRQIFNDANELIIHYIKRHMNPREKKGIENLLSTFIPKIFMLYGHIDDDQNEEIESESKDNNDGESTLNANQQLRTRRGRKKQTESSNIIVENKNENTHDANIIEELTYQCHQQQSLSHQQLPYTLFFGTHYWLLFVRLHAILCDRLAIIQKRTEELVEEYNVELKFQESQKQAYKKYGHSIDSHHLNAVDVHLGLREMKKPMQNPENFYQVMLQEMKNFLDGTVDSTNFEDNLRNMFHTKAYVLFTMDKLVSIIAIHLKNFVSDNISMKCVELFDNYHKKRNDICLEGELAKQANHDYESEAEKLLVNQNCYKMLFLNHNNPIITVELIDTNESENDSDEDEEEEKKCPNVVGLDYWNEFLKSNGIDDSKLIVSMKEISLPGIGFLNRNLRHRLLMGRNMNPEFTIYEDDKADSNDKEDAQNPATKKKVPQFFVSNGFCTLLNEENPIKILQSHTNWNEADVDIFIRKGAPGMGRKGHRKVSLLRRKRWSNWLEKRQGDQIISARWLTNGCQTRICQHFRFKYLKFTKYSSSSFIQ